MRTTDEKYPLMSIFSLSSRAQRGICSRRNRRQRTRTNRWLKELQSIQMEALVLIVLLVGPAFAKSPSCKGNPKVVSACYVVHGRATFGNGTPTLRIWPVGTKRMLGVTAGPIADDADDPIVPKNFGIPNGAEAVYGDFEVCPFTLERKGHMKMVCVESASNLAVKYPSSR
jgi:hypothetical protein